MNKIFEVIGKVVVSLVGAYLFVWMIIVIAGTLAEKPTQREEWTTFMECRATQTIPGFPTVWVVGAPIEWCQEEKP